MPEILDTTLRDGEQMDKVSFSPSEKLSIAKKLLEIGVNRIEVASARAVEEDKKAVKRICEMANTLGKLENVEVLGFVDKNISVDWIYDLGCRTINLLVKGSKKHCEGQLKKNLQEHLVDIKKTIDYAKDKLMTVNVYLEDWSNGIRDDVDYVFNLVKALHEMGV